MGLQSIKELEAAQSHAGVWTHSAVTNVPLPQRDRGGRAVGVGSVVVSSQAQGTLGGYRRDRSRRQIEAVVRGEFDQPVDATNLLRHTHPQ